MTIGQWVDWRSSSHTIEPPALYRWTFNFLVLPDGSRSIGGHGGEQRVLQDAGCQADAGPRVPNERGGAAGTNGPVRTAIIIGHALWERQFNRDPIIVGKTLQISRIRRRCRSSA